MAAQEFRIESDSPTTSDLMFWCLAGYECLGRSSVYELRVLSKNPSIDAKKVLGYAFDVVVAFGDASGAGHQRHAQGHAVRFARMAKVGRYHQYHISLRSWFWLMSKRVNSRIFQEQDILEVFDAVADSSSIKGIKKIDKDNVSGIHQVRRYCVQHQESDQAFISRLLEDEGIYYWFDAHEAPGTMHLSDSSTVAHTPLAADPVLKAWHYQAGSQPRFNELFYFTPCSQAGSGAYASRDSDFKVINKKLLADKSDPDVHEIADLEVFEFPGSYLNGDEREDIARIRMEELAARREFFEGRTNWADVAVGKSFTYEGNGLDEAPDGEYLIAGCVFCLRQPGYEGADSAAQAQVLQSQLEPLIQQHARDNPLFSEYADARQSWTQLQIHEVIESGAYDRGQGNFGFTAMRVQTPYRPPRLTQRPPMPGPQSAIVVGPQGEEIFADAMGRVKVQFHWDRYGESDENTTCWVRVSQPWAGKGWGGYFIPRIGQEVIVDFLNGDPDRPIIIGRVYNDEQTIPFASHTQSGFKTRSTPDGDVNNFNELRFEDAKGKEQIHMHAEKDLDMLVEKMETRKVGTNRFTKIGGMCQTSVGGKRTTDIGGMDVLKVVKDQKISIGGDQGETVNGKTKFTSMGDWHSAAPNIEVNGTLSYKLSSILISSIATASYDIKAATYSLSAPQVFIACSVLTQNAEIAQTIKAGVVMNLGAPIVQIDAKSSLILKCGASEIEMTPTSITLRSMEVKLNAGASISLASVGATSVDAFGPLSLNSAAVTSISGSIVKVNA